MIVIAAGSYYNLNDFNDFNAAHFPAVGSYQNLNDFDDFNAAHFFSAGSYHDLARHIPATGHTILHPKH